MKAKILTFVLLCCSPWVFSQTDSIKVGLLPRSFQTELFSVSTQYGTSYFLRPTNTQNGNNYSREVESTVSTAIHAFYPILNRKKFKIMFNGWYWDYRYTVNDKKSLVNPKGKWDVNTSFFIFAPELIWNFKLGERNFISRTTISNYGNEFTGSNKISFLTTLMTPISGNKNYNFLLGVGAIQILERKLIPFPLLVYNQMLGSNSSLHLTFPYELRFGYTDDPKYLLKFGCKLDPTSPFFAIDEVVGDQSIPDLEYKNLGIALGGEFQRQLYKMLWVSANANYRISASSEVTDLSGDRLAKLKAGNHWTFQLKLFIRPDFSKMMKGKK